MTQGFSNAKLSTMNSRLPIEPLRAFVQAAELGSFKAAAARLHLTPGALSQRIAELERFWGSALFRRGARGVVLSPEGQALFKRVADPLGLVEQALEEALQSHRRHRLRVHTVSSFANRWLVPRLARFNRLHPSIEVEVEGGTQLVDMMKQAEAPDLAIRYGAGRYDGLTAIELMRPGPVLVIRPELLKGEAAGSPGRLLRAHKLLREKDQSEWRLWLEQFGCKAAEVRWGLVLEDDAALVSAALSGQGIASVRSFYVRDLIESGELVAIAERPESEKAYFLVGRPKRFESPEVVAFQKWVLAEARSA